MIGALAVIFSVAAPFMILILGIRIGISHGRYREQLRTRERDRNDVHRATQTATVSALEKANLRHRVALRAVCDAYSALPQDDLLIRRCELALQSAQHDLDTLTYLSLGGHAS